MMNMPMLQTLPPATASFRAARHATEETKPSRLPPLPRRRREPPAAVTFSSLAWLKLLTFLHAGDTEVGGFGVSAKDQPLYIEDFVTVKQHTTAVTVAFDDMAVADYFDDCIDRGLTPARFARIWIHTHPGASPEPSSVDEETFSRVFGDCDWAVMLIVSRTQDTYARLSFSAGPGCSILLPVTVDWESWPQLLLERGGELSALAESWLDEYGRNIIPVAFFSELVEVNDRRPDTRVSSWTDRLWREDEMDAQYRLSLLDQELEDWYEAVEGR